MASSGVACGRVRSEVGSGVFEVGFVWFVRSFFVVDLPVPVVAQNKFLTSLV